MKRPLATGLGFCLGLGLAAFFVPAVHAQGYPDRPGLQDRRQPIPDKTASPRTTDPQAYDAIDLFSRVCVSTRGDHNRASSIIGSGDSAIEPMEEGLLRELEDAPGGKGWIIRMPLGDKILVELPGMGGCVVRAPRVNTAQLEVSFRNLLEQYASNERFIFRRLGEQTKTVDAPALPAGPNGRPALPAEKMKFRILGYRMTLPDTGQSADLVVSMTESQRPIVQATISYMMRSDKSDGDPK
ncbi:MAG TPA: hypothetical protein VL899_02380 [Alphaproteobacteria bacterium]|jgi:hypothetical protein|nr:hypothetical protein [Alphaproteobacteria bacterium]